MRIGLLEMRKFGKMFFENSVRTATFTEESAGVADLITSCSGGRNYRCAKMSVEEKISIQEVEKRELNGQMLQGTSTAKEVYDFLKARGKEEEFPLMTSTYRELLWLGDEKEVTANVMLQAYYKDRPMLRIYPT